MKPKILDLFCGAGGSAIGLRRAGFEVVGIDNTPMPRYPFHFIQADALTCDLSGFDAYWASPPCQAYSTLRGLNKKNYPDLVAATRWRLKGTGKPYIIENVMTAPLINAVMLCGVSFGLKVARHRLFESNCLLLVPPHVDHRGWTVRGALVQMYGRYKGFSLFKHEVEEAMGIYHMTGRELSEAIPPAYSEFLGKQLIQYIRGSRYQMDPDVSEV